MQISEIQTRVLMVEFDTFGRSGVEQTAAVKTPIISFVLIPMVSQDCGQEVSRSNLFKIALDEGAITKFEYRVICALFSVDVPDASLSVEERINRTCNEMNISADNLRRRIRPRIIDKVANYYGSKYDWIMKQSNNKHNSQYPSNISDFIDDNIDRLCRGYRYSVQVEKQEAVYDVITDYSRLRVLPNSQSFHVYICRTYESMQGAVKDEAIIGLELAELNAEEWDNYADSFECSLTLMNEFVPYENVVKTDNFLIFEFNRPEPTEMLDSANIICHYKLGAHVTRFPVKLINHFTTGGVNVDFSIKGSEISNLEYADYFAGFDGVSPLLERSVNVKRFPPSTGINGISIAIPANTLLFPGAGVEFFWNAE